MVLLLLVGLMGRGLGAEAEAETFQFQAETGRLMDIIINSLYTKKQIFLREVISNASDALDKLRFLAIQKPEIMKEEPELEIRVEVDEDQKALIIRDTGIGMTKAELINNLGTIARSGTTNFVQALKSGNINLIGQFGVGFYSTFLAGRKVQVISKSPEDVQHIWESEAASEYTIRKAEQPILTRGTQLTIFLKEETLEYLKEDKLQKLVSKYSGFIDFPIFLKKVDKEKDSFQWKRLNDNKAIWLRNSHEVEHEEYVHFFRSLVKREGVPLEWAHFSVEGQLNFRSVMFVPDHPPYRYYEEYNKAVNDIKLYVRRVLITDGNKELLPRYLSFMPGVVDSDELDLNVNRETIQHTKSMQVINEKLVKRAIDMFIEINKYNEVNEDELNVDDDELDSMNEHDREAELQRARDEQLKEKKRKFERFYFEFGRSIKLGVVEDTANKKKLASLLRFKSSKYNNLTSFDEYVRRLQEGQDVIYYFSGENEQMIKSAPIFRKMTNLDFEVLICDEAIDEFALQQVKQYEQYKLKNIGSADFVLPTENQASRKKKKALVKMFEPLKSYLEKTLYEYVARVDISSKGTSEPAMVTSTEGGQSAFMEKISRANSFTKKNNQPRNEVKRVLELNPDHLLVQKMLRMVTSNQTGAETEAIAHSLYETAAMQSGFYIRNPALYATHFYNVFSSALGVMGQERREIEYDLDEVQLPEDQPEEEVKRPDFTVEDAQD